MKRFAEAVVAFAVCACSAVGEEPAELLAEKAAAAAKEKSITVPGQAGWLFLASELRHLSVGPFWGDAAASVSRATSPQVADPLPAILDFHAQLQSNGVQLLVVPVPAKAAIYPDSLDESLPPPDDGNRLDGADSEFVKLLEKNGVAVLDLWPEFVENRSHPDGALYCRQDSHWSGNGCVVAAGKIAGRIRPWLGERGSATFDTEWQEIEISGDLWRGLNDPSVAKEVVRLRKVGARGGDGIEPVPSDDASPVVLLGDSHNLVFHDGGDMFARGAGLADQLAFELNVPVDVVAVRGSGATPARINLLRKAQKDPGYWKNKKVVVWCFAAREFTESDGWRLVPITPPGRAGSTH